MKLKRLCLTLAAVLLLNLCTVAAADTDYSEDPLLSRIQGSGVLTNDMLLAKSDNPKHYSDFTPRELKPGEVLRYGIDVSVHQGTIDWSAVSRAGVEFAFIRGGYRGWGTGQIIADSKMIENIKNAQANGIKVGVYIYSQATTVAEAQEEANYLISRLGGYNIELPLVIDFEYADQYNKQAEKWEKVGRLYNANLSRQAATDVINAFCRTAEAAGYYSAVYTGRYILRDDLYSDQISCPIWLANYTSNQSSSGLYAYSGAHTFWQCSGAGEVDGISTDVDLNFWYDDGYYDNMPFTDVHTSYWSYSDILNAYQKGIVNGMTATSYSPKSTTTRAQMVTMIYRAIGSPAVSGTSSFTDISRVTSWAGNAIAWAEASGVIQGYGDGRFGPDDPVTREDLVLMLHRTTGCPQDYRSLTGFSDISSIRSYAFEAVSWAASNGILLGDNGKIKPLDYATREQIAAFMNRYMTYAGL